MRFAVCSRSSILLLVCYFLLFGGDRAHAYIDPGTGSYLLQFLIGGLLAGAFVIKRFWFRIKAFLSRAPHKEQDGADE
jgi:hypothetical protein